MKLNEILNIADITKYKDLEDGIYMVSYGGTPISIEGDFIKHGNSIVDRPFYFSDLVINALGTSAILTYDNKSNLTIMELGTKCKQLGHVWAYNWLTVGILLKGQPPKVEKAFLRDTNFYQSWNLLYDNVYVMNGTLKSFRYFCMNRDDKSFDKDTRNAMNTIHQNFGYLWT